MRSIVLLAFISLLLISCGGSKKAALATAPSIRVEAGEIPLTRTIAPDHPEEEHTAEIPEFSPLISEVITTAMSYHGTRYKYGGTTKRGMDCSGLIYTSFETVDINLERTSAGMAQQGEKIRLKEVQKGDLLFFTTGRSRRINHVGLVVEVDSGEIKFIHSTTSRGVLVSSLREGYWNHAFDHARRII